MGTFVVSLNYVNPSLSVSTINVAIGAGLATTDNGYIFGGADSWASPTQKVDFSSGGIVSGSADQGQIKINNAANSIEASGQFDNLIRTVSFQGQTATLYYLRGNVWAEKILIDQGLTEQPVLSISEGAQVQHFLTFPLRDFRILLDKPLQSTRYLGNNPVGGGGVEGTSQDLIGKPKPILLGKVSNAPIPCVSRDLLIYQCCDAANVYSIGVADGGVGLTNSGGMPAWTSIGAMIAAAAPASGTFKVCFDSTYGTFVRLGSNPVKGITADLNLDISAMPDDVCWSTLSTRIGRTVLGATTLAQPPDCGYWWGPQDDVTQRQALDAILTSRSAVEVNRPSGWFMQNIDKTTAAAQWGTRYNLVMLQSDTRLATTDRKLLTASMARPPWCTNGAPPYRVTINWGKVYQVQSPSDLNSGASPFVIDTFGNQFRAASVTDASIWNDVTKTGMFNNAQEIRINTGIVLGGGAYPPPASAVAEADRLQAFLSDWTGCFQVSFIPKYVYDPVSPTVDTLYVGDAVTMNLPRYGHLGARYTVLQAGLLVDANGPVITAILGLEN